MDIVCFSHLRWNFVYQRPQHLLTRFAKYNRVFVWEEPFLDASEDFYTITQQPDSNIWVVVPHLKKDHNESNVNAAQTYLLNKLLQKLEINNYLLWYYSPMALSFSENLSPKLVVYDCMDELSGFKFAPPSLKEKEARLFNLADIVFTGGNHLYSAKKKSTS